MNIIEDDFIMPTDFGRAWIAGEVISRWPQQSMISGSWPLSFFHDFDPGDIDIFVDPAILNEVIEYLGMWNLVVTSDKETALYSGGGFMSVKLKDKNGAALKESMNVIAYDPVGGSLGFNPDEVWETFDLACCEVGVIYDASKSGFIMAASDRFMEYRTTGFVDTRKARRRVQLTHRIYKYVCRGFTHFKINGEDAIIVKHGIGYRGRMNASGLIWDVAIPQALRTSTVGEESPLDSSS